MAIRMDRTLRRQLDSLFNVGTIRNLTDGQLLERYATGGGEGAELAFAALVERHAPLVLRVCRAQLGDAHAAQDAFQATFLILVKKAGALWVRDSIGPWLHQVAFRTASCARSAEARRRRLERHGARPEADESPRDCEWEQTLHEELSRLPDRYRVPLVLCDLQGHSCEEAARQMGRPVGTVKSWRSRGRDRLRRRLLRLGLAPAAVLAANLAQAATPRVDRGLGAAVRALSDQMTAGAVPASVHGLVNGVLKAMLLSKLRTAAAGFLVLIIVASGLGAVARVGAQDEPADGKSPKMAAVPRPSSNPPRVQNLADTWPLSLREAIRIGLGNSDEVLVLKLGDGSTRKGTFVIAPRTPGVEPHRFKSEVMALARSVEQQYWALYQGHVQYRAAQTTVDLTEAIVKREETKRKAGSGKAKDLDWARQQLERFKLDFVDKTANLITADRQLRNLIGLPPADSRRIVPATLPLEARLEPKWEEALEIMQKKQPDVVRATERMKTAVGPDQANRDKTRHDQAMHETTHQLARFFLELDSNFKLFRTASESREVATQRLVSQRALHEKGAAAIADHLDAIMRYSASIAQEADFLACYNTAIAALEEAKGTLLDHDGVAIAYHPGGQTTAAALASDAMVRPASLDLVAMPPALTSPAPVAGKTYSFQMTIGGGPKPIEIRGSFTVSPATAPATPATALPVAR